MTAETLSTMPSRFTEAEWETRLELAALHRVIHLYGMTDIANQEIGARVKGQPECFLIHPYGMLFDEVCASDFVMVDLQGNVINGPGIWTGSGREDFVNHSGQRCLSVPSPRTTPSFLTITATTRWAGAPQRRSFEPITCVKRAQCKSKQWCPRWGQAIVYD